MKWLNSKNISKKKWFDLFSNYRLKISRGNSWISFIQTYIPLQYLLPIVGLKWAIVDKYPLWVIGLLGIVYSVLNEIFKFWLGGLDEKIGYWKAEAEWGQKNETINPFFCWIKKTLDNICDKLQINKEKL
ncbi:MAG: hypothetical protein PHT54_03615 [Candidatus Nanoarchaeia archaeon]|nr:hypothetical protein [Candidatus Nanoarchaeia archaeon]